MMKPEIMIITGVSGAGKTTIVRALQADPPPRCACHDVEDGRRPPNNAGDWSRREGAEHWLRIAIKDAKDQLSTALGGTLFPEDIHSCPSLPDAPPIRYLLFEADDEAIRARLHQRFATDEMRSELKRILGLTPEEFIPATLVYQKKLRSALQASECNWTTFDTSGSDEKDTLSFVREWIDLGANNSQEGTAK